MHAIFGFFSVLMAVVAMFFSLANLHPLDIHLWPFSRIMTLPVAFFTLFIFMLGFVFGAIASWSSLRQRYKKLKKKVKQDQKTDIHTPYS